MADKSISVIQTNGPTCNMWMEEIEVGLHEHDISRIQVARLGQTQIYTICICTFGETWDTIIFHPRKEKGWPFVYLGGQGMDTISC